MKGLGFELAIELMKYQLDLEKLDWVQDNLTSTWLDLISFLYLDFLFDKKNLNLITCS